MVVSVLSFTLELPGVGSLKEKRQVIRSLKDRIHQKFHVSVAEVDLNDVWTAAEIGCAMVSNSRRLGESVMQKIVGFAEDHAPGRLRDTEIFSEQYWR